MNSQINLSNKKNNFTISSIIKASNDKKNSSRSNTQEMPHYNRSKNKSSSCKYKKNKNANNSLYNNKKEEFPKKFTGIKNMNISTKINSETNSNTNTTKNENKNMNIYQFKEILNQKDKKIAELEKQIKMYRDKLKNQIRIFNINTSINSFNLSKTRSSTNITERNMCQIRSLSNSHAKIKTSYPLTRNLYGNKKGDNKANNNKNIIKNNKRPKSNNYRKPRYNNYMFGNKIHVNNFKRNAVNVKQKSKNKYQDNNSVKYKRAKSSNIEKNKNNIIISKSNAKYNNKIENLLSIEETQILCDKMMAKMKNVLELVKLATTGE
jgi:hypothetical protein